MSIVKTEVTGSTEGNHTDKLPGDLIEIIEGYEDSDL